MGLFSKRKDETPDVKVDEPSVSVLMPTSDGTPEPGPLPTAPTPAPAAPKARLGLAFGIEQAVGLLKSMPPGAGAPKAYMSVVKKTLEAVGVSIGQIIADGERRTSEVMAEIGALQEEVHALEAAATAKKARITELQTELEDIGQAQERFRGESTSLGLGTSTSTSTSAAPSPSPAAAAPSELGLAARIRTSQS